MDTLAFGYTLGTINPRLGLSPLRLRPCWAHTVKEILGVSSYKLKYKYLLCLEITILFIH